MTPSRQIRFSRIALEALLILVIGVLVGLSVNYRLVLDAFAGRLAPPAETAVPAAPDGEAAFPMPVDLEGVRQAAGTDVLLVDARIPELYREGHLPGAVNLPLAEVEQQLPGFLEQVPAGRPLILYCNGYGCPDSYDLALILIEKGYRDVSVFEGGLPAWEDAGLPVVSGEGQP